MTSAELCQQVASECDTVMLAFSTGKDAICSWLQLRRYFKRVIPYYGYLVPGLRFVEDSLRYYEDYFGCHIYRLPHPAFFRMLREHVYQSPPRRIMVQNMGLPEHREYNDDTIAAIMRDSLDLPPSAYMAIGVRTADSPIRRASIKAHGPLNRNRRVFYPIFDWLKADILRELREANIKLPVDYKMFGRTFDGLDYRFTKPISEWFPGDYERIRNWFPLIDMSIAKWEGLDGIPSESKARSGT